MTDITELAQSLKAAANKAGADDWQAKKISGEFYVIRKGSYSSKCGYRTYQPIAEIDHKSTRDYVAIASPANILALVEALEKAQQVDEELCKLLPPGVEYMDPPDGGDVTPLEGVRRMVADYRQLIAELESRTVTAAAADVLAERLRQVTAEGWTAERDDGYQNSELADAAACYAIHAHNQGFSTPAHWPWSQDWWKQRSPRRDLVKAGALILAEIERLDRAAGIKVEVE